MGSLLAFFGALAAACWDVETGRIPNALIVCLWMAGAAVAVGSVGIFPPDAGGDGPALFAAAGAASPLIALWPLYRRGLMGAGDIKLLSGLGGLIGLRAVAVCFAAAVAAAGGISALLILSDGFGRARYARLHFAVPVLMGVMVVCSGA